MVRRRAPASAASTAIARAAPHRAIDRADGLGRFAEAVEMGDDRDLVRDRAVEAAPAHRPRAERGVAERRGLDFAVDVARVHAVMTERRFDHRHGRILGCRRREAADQLGEKIMRRRHPRSPRSPETARRRLDRAARLPQRIVRALHRRRKDRTARPQCRRSSSLAPVERSEDGASRRRSPVIPP